MLKIRYVKVLKSLFLILLFSNILYSQIPFDQPFKMIKPLIKPVYLTVGDTIAIVAPSGVLKNNESIVKAKKLAEKWGLKVVIGKYVLENNHHFAGTDAQRLSDFQNALDAKNIKAIWCARGGYGSVRIIDMLDFTEFIKNPKWIVGYSDITVFHNHIHNMGIETLHALMCTSLITENEDKQMSIESLKNALFGKSVQYAIPVSKFNKKGTAKGQLVGGNLSILQSLLASSSSINTVGKILFIEDVGEYLYHIDRMMYALKRSGYFNGCAGLIVGGMTEIKKNTTPFGKSVEALILEATKEYSFPILFDFPAGHGDKNEAIFLGREIEMTVGDEHAIVKYTN